MSSNRRNSRGPLQQDPYFWKALEGVPVQKPAVIVIRDCVESRAACSMKALAIEWTEKPDPWGPWYKITMAGHKSNAWYGFWDLLPS